MMKRIVLLTLSALLATSSFAQMAGGVSKSYKSSRNSNAEYHRGYKGFIEAGGSLGLNSTFYDYYDKEYTDNGATFTGGLYTTHGYQINSYLFAGAGIGAEYSWSAEKLILPVYGEIRCNILNPNLHKKTPFIGVRVGANVFKKSHNGLFGNLFFGYRIPMKNSLALNLSVGYQLHKYSYLQEWSYYYSWDNYTEYRELNTKTTDHTCSIHVGIEF